MGEKQTGTIRSETGRADDGMGKGEARSMGMASNAMKGGGTSGSVRNESPPPSPSAAPGNRPSTGKLRI